MKSTCQTASAHPLRGAAPSPAAFSQAELLPFLLNPQSYPHRPKRVRLVQTHASLVFIAAPFVYKLKKPVNFGFLDFSTPEKREFFCRREVELNRRLSPDVYLGVVPIAKNGGGHSFGTEGEIVDHLVQMRKLDERYFLDRLVARGAVGPGAMDRLTRVLARFYRAQHPGPEIEVWGKVARLKISTDENFRQAERFIGRTVSRPAFAAIREYTNGFYRSHAQLLAARVRDKWIRDCHGDLHLEHIQLTSRGVHIYDCIEFNDRFRYVDVANDIAFLAMDLDYVGRGDLGAHLVAKIAAALGDPDMPALMDFYKCYRAFVRGKVESLHSEAATAPAAERAAAAERAQRYFRLALRYAIAGSRPAVLVVMGRIASGKSTLARALGDELGWKVCSSDQARKEIAGFPLYERTPAAARGRLYSARMTRKTYREIIAAALAEIAGRRGAVLDATFGQGAQRDQLRRRLGPARSGLHFLEVSAGTATVRARLRERETRSDEVSDARLEDLPALSRRYEPPREVPPAQLTRVPNRGRAEQTLLAAMKALARRQARRMLSTNPRKPGRPAA